MADKLTAKQQAFCESYVANGFNATQAAITAGYSEKTAKDIGCENLAKPNIAEYIFEFKAKASEKALVTTEDIVRGLLVEAKGEGEDTSTSSRVAAYKALSDYTGGFDNNKNKTDITSGGKPIKNEWHIHPVTANKDGAS
jgi:phage terminase small subunit